MQTCKIPSILLCKQQEDEKGAPLNAEMVTRFPPSFIFVDGKWIRCKRTKHEGGEETVLCANNTLLGPTRNYTPLDRFSFLVKIIYLSGENGGRGIRMSPPP